MLIFLSSSSVYFLYKYNKIRNELESKNKSIKVLQSKVKNLENELNEIKNIYSLEDIEKFEEQLLKELAYKDNIDDIFNKLKAFDEEEKQLLKELWNKLNNSFNQTKNYEKKIEKIYNYSYRVNINWKEYYYKFFINNNYISWIIYSDDNEILKKIKEKLENFSLNIKKKWNRIVFRWKINVKDINKLLNILNLKSIKTKNFFYEIKNKTKWF